MNNCLLFRGSAKSIAFFAVAPFLVLMLTGPARAATPNNFIRGQFQEINDNGAWSWFMDERLLLDRGRLIVGSARASGRFDQAHLPGWGNIELAVLDLATGQSRVILLHEGFEQDDHNNPGLLTLSDGRYLAVYSKHGQETKLYQRLSVRPGDPFEWGPIQEISTPGRARAFGGDSVTYANPMQLSAENGRLYLFHRGVGADPNYLVSEDGARTWRYGGRLHHSDGRELGPLATSTNATLGAWEFTKIYQGGPTNVAWMSDIHLDADERPVVLFTTQRDGAGQPMGAGGYDHRFHYARWDGERWHEHEIAFAGTRLYPGEDDYTGLGAIDPQNVSVVYISTDADPVTGRPLISRAVYRRHHEIFRGETQDGGRTWHWLPVTVHSVTGNFRPMVPVGRDDQGRTTLVWMRGAYQVNRGEWTTAVAATILKPEDFRD